MRKTASEVAEIDRVNAKLLAGGYDEVRGGAKKESDDSSVQKIPLSPAESNPNLPRSTTPENLLNNLKN